ncbi:hypothetical protein O6H91_11G020200 [Diphasiastrum complanatum]|uniref:Uncharacterized protein n=1 Tax=Diphasiastrum complanatum TaxID=34168 RepID=A0ACC2C7A1_DIPCM|nr:hypothetical protein O6H91_11G020200 [Diphasiastrum complanatum]
MNSIHIASNPRQRRSAMLTFCASLKILHMLWLLSLTSPILSTAYVLGNDATALLSFLKGVKGASVSNLSTWHKNTLNPNGCPSEWYGVTCSNGRITGLHLGGLKLSGVITEGTLGALSQLSSLILSSNFFWGSLPNDLGGLSALKELDLSNNLFNGSIPPSLGSLQNLVNLIFAGNKLDGIIPDMFHKMTSLVLADLSNNSLSGEIPKTLTLLPQLSTLNLSYNELTGSLPTNLGVLQQLRILELSHNKLSGSIDRSLTSLDKLIYVDLSENSFSGPLPWQQILPVSLGIVHLNLSYNQFSGPLAPANAGNLFANQLQTLDVSSNRLSGELPSFQFVFALKVLKLQNNSFTGGVPPALLTADSSILEDIDLSMNKLSGKLGSVTAKNLLSLNLSFNLLSGMLPKSLGICSAVDLSKNLFSGDLSGMKIWSDSLMILDLSHNFLTGNLPNQTAQLAQLIFLNLSHNSISGSIPFSFGLYQKLTFLDLTFNQLTGLVPMSFFHSSSLTELRLAHNLLYGSIVLDSVHSVDSVPSQQINPRSDFSPLSSFAYSPLVVLDLSWNYLNGCIPLRFGSLTTLEVVDLSKNELIGSISEQFSRLANLQSLDLSFNQLVGELPSSLPVGLQALNVSNNHFSGHIPPILQHKFPMSSFFPGNSGLSLENDPLSFPPDMNGPVSITQGKRERNSLSAKAGLIGGCIAVAVLIFLVGLFAYHKRTFRTHKKARTSEFCVINKESDQQSGKTAGSLHRPDHVGQNDVVVIPGATMDFSKEQLFCLENVTFSETTANLKVRSPDKLAGDLFLLDNSIIFTAEELSRAPAAVLGRSGFGTSYKATLDNGHVLVVKWLREGLVKSKKDFTKEARNYSTIRHSNVMPLRGYYWGPREHEKLIVSDFMSSGSLAGRLFERAGRRFSPLNWLQRLRIAIDVARGMSYLHLQHRLPHGNLKATNVLLHGQDPDGCISDYGLHSLMTRSGTANLIISAGALGYQAPELANARITKPSFKADVYAFGILLLELLTGRGAGDIMPESSGAVDLPGWVRLLVNDEHSSDCFDQAFANVEEDRDHSKGLHQVLKIALKCLSPHRARPNIRSVYEELADISSYP